MKQKKLVSFAILLFHLIMLFPLVFINFANSNKENRNLAEMPKIWQNGSVNFNYPKQLEVWFNDHLGGRDWFISANAQIHYWLKTSPTEAVIIGKDDQLFYNDVTLNWARPIHNYQNANLFTQEELEKFKTIFTRRYNLFKEHGIQMAMIIVPDKESIYGENYGYGINKISEISRTDQLIRYMIEAAKIDIIDVRKSLLLQKDQYELYLKTDSHWNQMGAFWAYEEIQKKLIDFFPQIRPIVIEKYQVASELTNAGNLIDLTAFPEGGYKAKFYHFTLKNFQEKTYYTAVDTIDNQQMIRIVTKKDDNSLPKAIVFRDSFTREYIPFMSEDFSQIEYIWQNGNIDYFIQYIIDQKPDIVIFESLENYLPFWLQAPAMSAMPYKNEEFILNFTEKTNGTDYMLSGFYPAELLGTWSMGEQSSIYIPIEDLIRDFNLIISGQFLALAENMQAEILINGKSVGLIQEDGQKCFRISKEQVGQASSLLITLKHPITLNPNQTTADRDISFQIQSLTMKPI